jgi:Acetyltransferases, including N-acetylases of ribosomal proteins
MITLRDVTISDKSIYENWQNDSNLTGCMSRFCPYNSSVEDYNTERICWFVIEKDACDVGSVWIEKEQESSDTATLGIFISGEQYRGKGLGSEAIKEAIRISRRRIDFQKVRLNVRKNNPGAVQCYMKCGFTITGEGQKVSLDATVIPYYSMEVKADV